MTFQQFMDTYGPVRENQYPDRPTSDDQVTISWVENGKTISIEVPKSWNDALRGFIELQMKTQTL